MTSIQTLLELGKEIGLEGKDLHDLVKEQQAYEREERQRERERQKEEDERKQLYEAQQHAQRLEFEAQQCAHQLQLTEANIKLEEVRNRTALEAEERNGSATRRQISRNASCPKPQVKVPKFDESQLASVSEYLNVFEAVMQENECPERTWGLHLRTTVLGPTLAEISGMTGTYNDLKRELLTAYRQLPEELWECILTSQQKVTESFRQYCSRHENN